MRISDWSSDVCSSDLQAGHPHFLRDHASAHDPVLPNRGTPGPFQGCLRIRSSIEPMFQPGKCEASPRPGLGARRTGRDGRRWPSGRSRWRYLRSEEHTSELQSLMRNSYAVFCLKKKKQINITHIIYTTNTKYTASRSTITDN